jgi:hypothetical protein
MNLMHAVRTIVPGSVAAALMGCAHDITISGDPATLATSTAAVKTEPINKTVGLVITDDLRTKEVVTPVSRSR